MRAEWQAHINEPLGQHRSMSDQMSQTQQQIAQMRGVAESANRWVRVTVGPHGELTNLELDPRLYRTPDSQDSPS